MKDPKEHPSNIGHVCSGCAPKPGGFGDLSPASFVGKTVKLGFPTGRKGSPQIEHMWVEVTEVIEMAGRPALRGKLDNDPMFAPGECGDIVNFTPDEIEAVYSEDEPS